jgi:two-component system NarL family sensor kinase
MPDALLTEGLIYAIDYFCNGISKTTNISISFQFFGNLPTIPVDMEINIYRILQELVQNVVKHAGATEVLVQVYGRENLITLTIDDNGKGMKDLSKVENGMGIRSIRSRLKVMNGDMDLRSTPAEGTEVHIEIPVSPAKQQSG